ncbi:MAG: zinc-binding dehydrogenase, partial [Desemzia incerta]
VTKVKKGDRVIIPFNIACGQCWYCNHELESQCDNSNPNPMFDQGGLFGFGKMNGNYPGGQAEYLRVPFADFTSFVVPESNLPDEKVLFLSDILPTAYWSVEHSGMKAGDTVIVLGSGPVGLFVQQFAKMKGAARVIAVDNVDHRLQHAKKMNGVETVNFSNVSEVGDQLYEMTKGGAEIVIDCVGMDGVKPLKEKAKDFVSLQSGSYSPIQTASEAVKKFGTIMVTGVYMTPAANFPFHNIFTRNVDIKSGQAPVIHLMPKIYDMIEKDMFDPTSIITHTMPLERAAEAYDIFDKKADDNIKVVLKPGMS